MRDDDRIDREIREELEFHIEMRARDNLAAGMSPQEARADAERRFGTVADVHARVRVHELTALRGGMRTQWLRDSWGDVRFAFRSLSRKPVFVLAAVFTLALGIGANTAMFSLASALLLRTVPGVQDPGTLARFHFGSRTSREVMFFVSHGDYADLAGALNPFVESLSTASLNSAHVALPGHELPRRLLTLLVTSNYFSVLGLRPQLGIAPGPQHRAGTPVVMISDHLWSTAFARAPDVLGSTLLVNGRPAEIIGVGPSGFRGPDLLSEIDLWMPIEAHIALFPGIATEWLSDRRRSAHAVLIGRLAPGATAAQAEAALQATAERIAEVNAQSQLRDVVVVATPGIGLSSYARREFTGVLRVLGGVVGFLLLLACANAANLLLVRGAARTIELSIRRAIGASRGRLVRQLLTEAVLLAVAGGVAGLGFAWLVLRLLRGERVVSWLPELDRIPLDHRVLLFALVASLATGLLFGALPALTSTRRAEQALRGTRATGGTRWRNALVIVQVALSLALVVGAGLLLDTVRSLRAVDLGFESAGVTEASVNPGTQGYDDTAVAAYYDELLRRVRAAPDVASAGLAWAPVLGNILSMRTVRPEGVDREDARAARTRSNTISPGFFATLGMRIIEGRDFREDDLAPTAGGGKLILSESAARQVFPEGGAVGRRVDIGWGDEPEIAEVVGIVADARIDSPHEEPAALSYLPLVRDDDLTSWLTLYARSHSGEPLASQLHAIARELDAALPVYDVQSLPARIDSKLSAERMLARLTGLFASLALFLAAIGIYGVMAYAVAERAREFGVRMALGARPAGVRHMVLAQGLGTVGIGIAIGLFLATQLGRLVASRLYGVRVMEPLILVAAAATVLLAGAFAIWAPAWRATRVDPVTVLRE